VLLAIPPGYATAVWPAAGIALGSVMLLGQRALVGIAIGSFFVNFRLDLDLSTTSMIARSLVITGNIAAGAVLQAGVCARLECRYVDAPLKLEHPRDIVRFLALGGPVGCVVSASCGVTTLFLGGALPGPAFAFSWWTWWVGDVIGTIIFAPLVLALFAGSVHRWRRRRLEVVLPLSLGFCAVTGFSIYLSAWENQHLETEFARHARVLATALERRLDQTGELVRSVTSLYQVKRDVTRSDFRTFVRGSLGPEPLGKFGWVPRVRTLEHAESFPIAFIEPHEGNESLLGLDLGSEPASAASVRRARDEGRLVAAPVRLRGASGVLVLAPVFDDHEPPASVAGRRLTLRGMVAALIPTDLLTGLLANLGHEGMNIRVLSGTTVLFGGNERTGPAPMRWSTALDIDGSSWIFECTAVGPLEPRWQAWTVLAGGLLFVGMLGGVQLLISGRTALVIESEAHKTRLLRRLRASEERLRLAQEVAHIGSFEWNIQTGVNTWTPELEIMHGLPVGGFTGTHEAWQNLVHPDDRADAMKLIAKSFDAPATTEAEWRVVWPDGTVHWIAARWQLLRDASGAPLRVAGINMDITARKRAEAERERLLGEIRQLGKELESRVDERTRELATASSRIEGIIAIAADAIISTDEQQRITIFNKGAEEIFGWTRDEVLGQNLDVLLPERFRTIHREHVTAFAVEPGVARRMAERLPVFGRRKNGEEFPAEAAISRLRTPTEVLFTVILRDISERQRLEAERARTFDERGVLLKEVHHRVKNNLQVISSLFALQGRSTSHEEFRALLDESQTRIQSIALVHDQLYRAANLAEIDFDAYLRDEIVGIQSAYSPITGAIAVEIDARGIVLSVDHAVPCGLLVNELVSNAFKHAFRGRAAGTVRVAVHDTGSELVLDVIDDGVGIPPDFDWRATPTLGLQLVHGLTAQLRGSVELDRTHGTRFTVRFPHVRKPRKEAVA
jgi:PAS domain S-box-containing protein